MLLLRILGGGWQKINTSANMNKQTILEVREQIQEDLNSMLESQLGLIEYLQDVQDLACQIVVDNFEKLLEKS
jgi:hypothetical protein